MVPAVLIAAAVTEATGWTIPAAMLALERENTALQGPYDTGGKWLTATFAGSTRRTARTRQVNAPSVLFLNARSSRRSAAVVRDSNLRSMPGSHTW